MQGSNDMWLLCTGAQYERLPIEIWTKHTEQMCSIPRRTRSVESAMPNQEGRDGQNEGGVQNAASIPSSSEYSKIGYPARDIYHHCPRRSSSQSATSTQTSRITRNRSHIEQGQERNYGETMTDPSDQNNQSTQGGGSQISEETSYVQEGG